jgi:hypothetical protein
MTFDLQRILESKRQLRRTLASRPVAEKLAMLDDLRERTRALRAATTRPETAEAHETPLEYQVVRRKD